MAARAKNIADLTERQGSIRRWYEEKTMRMLHLAPSGSSMLEILGEWPALYPPWTRPFGDYDADTFGPLLAVSDDGAAAPTISKAAVAYQDQPQGGRECDKCLQFVSPDGCKIVEGTISPHGSCRIFQPLSQSS